MHNIIIGKKLGITQLISDGGKVDVVTAIKVDDCFVLNLKKENDKTRLVVAYGDIKEKKVNKARKGIFDAYGVAPKAHIREYLVDKIDGLKEKEPISPKLFKEKDKVAVRSKSKGKGFAGTIKRWNFKRGPMTHGSKSHRLPGSIGGGTTPGRVLKGKKMAGHMGNAYVTVKGLEILRIDESENVMLLKGSIPGNKGSFVEIWN
jgi:large subunit ribosomal protein L3